MDRFQFYFLLQVSDTMMITSKYEKSKLIQSAPVQGNENVNEGR